MHVLQQLHRTIPARTRAVAVVVSETSDRNVQHPVLVHMLSAATVTTLAHRSLRSSVCQHSRDDSDVILKPNTGGVAW